MNIGHQEGPSDCGLFAIAMAYDLCTGVNPVTRIYVQCKSSPCFGNKLLK